MSITKDFGGGIKVHGFQTGTVAVKSTHYQYSGPNFLKMPFILFGWKWITPMPIWAWAVETPFGKYLVDTGETTSFYSSGHFSDPVENYVYRKILQIDIQEDQQINCQLSEVGLSPKDIDAVIYTHLHLDHTDGITFFSNAEHLVHAKELERPFGVPFSSFPKWFSPKRIVHKNTSLPFMGSYSIDPHLEIIATPGHTWGHQSVILHTEHYDVILAGDTSFNEYQLLTKKVGGINVDTRLSRATLENLQLYCREKRVIYLPSHDRDSGKRLMELIETRE